VGSRYFELKIKISESAETEKIIAVLYTMGFEGFREEDEALLAYRHGDVTEFSKIQEALKNHNLQFQDSDFEQGIIEDQNWNTSWEQNFDPVTIKERCLIKAPFHIIDKEYPYSITLEPKMSFGTGHHETTRLMLEEMLDIDFTGKTVLDMGCGTGLLSIFVSLKGGKEVDAIDIDSWAFDNTLENLENNNIPNVNVFLGDAGLFANKKYDVILANINKNILLDDMESYLEVLKPGCFIVLSGFYKKDNDEIQEKLSSLGCKIHAFRELNNWALITARSST
jgi:ribosomal protein L11 methyltransferase